jgi:glutamate carboxypeptidase
MSSAIQSVEWIDSQAQRMLELVERWANINSASDNPDGLGQMAAELADTFTPLGGQMRLIDLPPAQIIDSSGQAVQKPLGRALSIIKRPDAPLRVFLGIHMDTVYGVDHPFQTTQRLGPTMLRGPGVADAKSGIVVMLVALEALERSDVADLIGWEVLINPDEELGSPGSTPLLSQCAKRNHLGFVFEPTLADGSLAGQRKGSGNFTIVVRGRCAHAGREFHLGCNAITAMATGITELDELNGRFEGLAINIAQVKGGGPVNMVPDLAICRLNVRYVDAQQETIVQSKLEEMVRQLDERTGIRAEWHGGFTAPPKPLNEPMRHLLEHVADCGRELGVDITWQSTGGACDGNRLAAAGLPNVDTMGVCGGDIHSPDEYLLIDSLPERAKLTALLLMKLASGQVAWPKRRNRGLMNS